MAPPVTLQPKCSVPLVLSQPTPDTEPFLQLKRVASALSKYLA